MPTTPQLIETKRNNHIVSRKDYSFINWVRMVSMFTIVVVHNLTLPSPPSNLPINEQAGFPVFNLLTPDQALPMITFVQCLRFGTLHFFIVAGFLIGKTLDRNSPLEYFKRRLGTIAIPFLIAFILFCLKSLLFNFYTENFSRADEYTSYAINKILLFLAATPYWFIPTYFLSLAILLLCQQYLPKLWFGGLLLLVNLFYALNIHCNWIEAGHTQAMFGFVFYLWLGYTFARLESVSTNTKAISNGALTVLTVFLFLLSLIETHFLLNAKTPDPINSLRLTNQLFAVSLFFLVARNNYMNRLSFLDPRVESFGLYLYHMFFTIALNRLFTTSTWFNPFLYHTSYSGTELVLISLSKGVIAYIFTLILVKALATSRFRWLIGLHQVRQ